MSPKSCESISPTEPKYGFKTKYGVSIACKRDTGTYIHIHTYIHIYIHTYTIYMIQANTYTYIHICIGAWWGTQRHQYLRNVHRHNKSTCCARCKAARPGHSARPKIRAIASGTDLITILRCFLSFKTVFTSPNIIVFKIKFP